jgi:orotate phosphoribosyltransferase
VGGRGLARRRGRRIDTTVTQRGPTAAALLELAAAREGHFRLESGYHAGLWLDLDALFAHASRIDPFVDALVAALRLYRIDIVCGALVGGAFLAQLLARRLDAMFCFTERLMPTDAVGLYSASYRLPPAFAATMRGKRVAVVDDVMSAGSAMIGSYTAVREDGGVPVVAAALMVLGSTGESFFVRHQLPVEAVIRRDFDLWSPSECPMCAASVPLEAPGDR